MGFVLSRIFGGDSEIDLTSIIIILSAGGFLFAIDLLLRTKRVTSQWNPADLLEFYRRDAAYSKMDLRSQRRLYHSSNEVASERTD